MSKKLLLWGLGTTVLIFILTIVLIFTVAMTTQNKAVNLEEQALESISAIEVKEKRRADLILNLVDTVKNYDKHEKDTLTLLAEARTSAEGGNVEQATTAINAVAEAYPELKSQANYQNLMTELAVTENLIAEQRDNYNRQVKAYNKFVRKFPSSIVLPLVGYEEQEFEYLEYEASSDAPTNLFDNQTGDRE